MRRLSFLSPSEPVALRRLSFLPPVRKIAGFTRPSQANAAAFEEAVAATPKAGSLGGDVVFKLHDTFGFPKELTRELVEDVGLTIDEAGFPGYQALTWFAMVAPPNTPDPITEKIYRDVAEVYR